MADYPRPGAFLLFLVKPRSRDDPPRICRRNGPLLAMVGNFRGAIMQGSSTPGLAMASPQGCRVTGVLEVTLPRSPLCAVKHGQVVGRLALREK